MGGCSSGVWGACASCQLSWGAIDLSWEIVGLSWGAMSLSWEIVELSWAVPWSWGLLEGSPPRVGLRTMPRSQPVMEPLVGGARRAWSSFFRTPLPALGMLFADPGVAGNQERWVISERLSFCLSS